MSKRKTQKTGLASQLPLAIKTGAYVVGYKQTLKTIIGESSKVVILAANTPDFMRRRIEYYCALANDTPIEYYAGSNNDLGTLSGLNKRCGAISITNQGEADFAELKE